MATYTLDCHDCGEACQIHRSDGKYCRSCSLLRVLKYASKLKKQAPKCKACETKFRPLNRTDYALCGSCTPPAPQWHSDTCLLCKHPAQMPYRGVAVCLTCLKDPLQRPVVMQALARGQKQRKAKNAGRPRAELRRIS